ncbi:unnamed protein product, partial [Staurois parvus]
MPLQTQLLLCKSNSDIITVLHIVFAESRAVGGAQQVHSPQAACRKLQEGVETRPGTLHKEKEQQQLMFKRQSFTPDYCTDLEEIHKSYQDLSKNN